MSPPLSGQTAWEVALLAWAAMTVGCTRCNDIDACRQQPPLERRLNTEFPGKQAVIAAVALPGGNAAIAFESTVSGEQAQLRIVTVDHDGAVSEHCAGSSPENHTIASMSVGPDGLRRRVALAGPGGEGQVGVAVFVRAEDGGRGVISARAFDTFGCPYGTELVLAETAIGEDLGTPAIVNLETRVGREFIVFWYDRPAGGGPVLMARIIKVTGDWLSPAVGGAVPLAIGNSGCSPLALSLGVGLVAVFWLEVGASTSSDGIGESLAENRLWMATLRDRLGVELKPRVVARWEGGMHEFAAAFDESTLLITWLARDESGEIRLFGRAVDQRGSPVNGGADGTDVVVRLGTSTGVSDALPSIAPLPRGGFLVAWRQTATEADTHGLRGRVLTGSGEARFNGVACSAADFPLSQTINGDPRESSSVLLPGAGAVVVAWSDVGPIGDDPDQEVRGVAVRLGEILADAQREVRVAAAAQVDPEETCLAEPGSRGSGEPCECPSDCPPGIECSPEWMDGFPHGRCVTPCGPDAGRGCGPSEACIDGVCTPRCSAGVECPPGRICRAGACRAFCAGDVDCRSASCDAYTGRCRSADWLLGDAGGGIDAPCADAPDCKSGTCDGVTHTCFVYCNPRRPSCPDGALCSPVDAAIGLCHRASAFNPHGHFSACSSTLECHAGALCYPELPFGYPGGACILGCMSSSAEPCGRDGTCLDGTCYDTCRAASDCPDGRVCSGGACLPLCVANEDCASRRCDGYAGVCVEPDAGPRGGGGVDDACGSHGDCRSGRCSGGRCVSPCSVRRARCPEDAGCVAVAGKSDLGECHHPSVPGFFPCTGDEACGVGGTCKSELASGWPHGGCWRVCGGECGEGERCVEGQCMKQCTTTADCGPDPGRLCHAGSCMPFCAVDDDCASRHCDLYTGRCYDGGPIGGGGLGAQCTLDIRCRSLDCRGEPEVCHVSCQVSRPSCPEGARCVGDGGDDLGECLK